MAGPITLTHESMRRFFMSIPNAVSLVMRAGAYALGGEIFILHMKSVCVKDLAELMIEEYAPKVGRHPNDIKILVTGAEPGEKNG